MNWIQLTNLAQLNELAETSLDKAVILFKHSTRCSVSRMALKQFENEFNCEPHLLDAYFLDLIAYRDISNEITTRFAVVHQSPQLLLIKNRIAVYTVSHSDIDAAALINQLT